MANKKAFLIYFELNEVKNKLEITTIPHRPRGLVGKTTPDSAASSRKHDNGKRK
jgi:hypothetical protein